MEEKNYTYIAQILNEDNEVITKVFSYSQEGLLEELSKGKWLNAIFVYETQQELEKDIDGEQAEDLKDGDRIPTDYEQPLTESELEGDIKQP
jgi:hypothetical protein